METITVEFVGGPMDGTELVFIEGVIVASIFIRVYVQVSSNDGLGLVEKLRVHRYGLDFFNQTKYIYQGIVEN